MEEVFDRFIEYLEKMNEKDWDVLVDSNWTIKDVVAHLVGWEDESIKVLREARKTGKKPWFLDYSDLDYVGFNRKNVKKYKNYSPKQLLSEWKRLAKITEEEIEGIRQETLKEKDWVFDDSHYLEHFKQIKKILEK